MNIKGLVGLIIAGCFLLTSCDLLKKDDDEKKKDCRTYAAEAVVSSSTVSDFPEGTVITCSFDSAALQYTCLATAQGQTVESYFQYNSIADFVDEKMIMGKMLRIKEKSFNGKTYCYTYDAEKRLSVETSDEDLKDGNCSDNSKKTFTVWDTEGRPTSGSYDITSSYLTCTGIAMTYEYDDTARTMKETRDFSASACAHDTIYSSTYAYDDNNFMLKMASSSNGSGDSPSEYVISTNSTASVCK